MFVMIIIVLESIYCYLHRMTDVATTDENTAIVDPVQDDEYKMIDTVDQNELLINTFNCFFFHNSSTMGDQYTLPTIDFNQQQTTVFDQTAGDQLKAIYNFNNNDPDDELLKNLLTRLKRFSNKIQTTSSRSKVIKKKRKSTNKRTKKTHVATNPWTTVKQQKRMPTKIVTYKPSDKVERLLNDSRGTCKYLLDYDNLIGTMSCTSTPNTSRSLSRNQTPTRHYDVIMDDEYICMSGPMNDHNSKNNVHNECWSVKSSSSGYFSDF